MNLQGIAIPFFTEAQWNAARTIMEDGKTFHDSYAEFVDRVVQAETQLRAQGQATVRINIEPQVFAKWCRAHGRKINSESRSLYATRKAMETDGSRMD
jgi:phage antirepressor YoqD-like protein